MAKVAAIILAAGLGARFKAAGGEGAKVLARHQGEPMVRRVARIALASRARPVIVVTGAEPEGVKAALAGLDVALAHNPDFRDGLSTSLRAGLAALSGDCDAALILLADMPGIEPTLLDAMIAAFGARPSAMALVPVRGGRRGNPALVSRAMFGALRALTGDEGAGRLLRAAAAGTLVEVEAPSDAIFQDADTPEALRTI